jgi:hypothetical protein
MCVCLLFMLMQRYEKQMNLTSCCVILYLLKKNSNPFLKLLNRPFSKLIKTLPNFFY